ncbi:hypothetical protein [Mycobacterium sp. 48b]|uniref:hypothetical protein n=1 Tax=Mycobacterium sp. 48b TaxID=3400426 RepID=UPI003AAD84E9
MFGGALLLGRGDSRGRRVVLTASTAVIVLSLIEFAVWIGARLSVWADQGVLGVTRWTWFALSIITLIVVLLAGNESLSTAADPEARAPRPQRDTRLLVAVLALAMAGYQLWLAKNQFDYSLRYIADLTDLLPTTPSATWPLAMLEPLFVSVVAAVVLILGAGLMAAGAAAGRFVVIAGCIITVAQGIFGWTDLDRLFHEIGGTDLLTIFAPRTASVVVLTLTVPVVTAVLAAAAPTAPRT